MGYFMKNRINFLMFVYVKNILAQGLVIDSANDTVPEFNSRFSVVQDFSYGVTHSPHPFYNLNKAILMPKIFT